MGFLIGKVLQGIVSFFSNGGPGHNIGTAVTNVGALAALAPAVIWLVTHKDEIAVTLSWGQLAFIGALIFALIKIAHFTRYGRMENRSEYH